MSGDGYTYEEEEIVIQMVSQGDEALDSDATSNLGDTSTPDFKKGCHEQGEEPSVQQVLQEIREDSCKKQGHAHGKPSLHLLADARISQWPQSDTVCMVDYHPYWDFPSWVAALHAETVRITCNTVVIYFEKVQVYQDVPPIKNPLQAMCKIIEQHNRSVRIFVANLLPRVTHSPVDRPLSEVNFVLLQAVKSISRAMGGKVHFLSLYEHFTSKRGSVIAPTYRYFLEDNTSLSKYGCMVMRECILREAGLKTYWFT